jgi:hypothetical protein
MRAAGATVLVAARKEKLFDPPMELPPLVVRSMYGPSLGLLIRHMRCHLFLNIAAFACELAFSLADPG